MNSNALEKLKRSLVARTTSDFGIGVVSKNAVDAAIQVAYQRNEPLMLIASRRQIECESFGGGYVGNWSTQTFASYVRERDPRGLVLLCRDHGGPWQHPCEWDNDFDEDRAIESAKCSYRSDIENGFAILHIDTGVSPKGEPLLKTAIARLVHLYEWCCHYAKQQGRAIAIEIGTEDQRGEAADPHSFREMWDAISKELNRLKLSRPLFVVAQTGTKVVEAENVGAFTIASSQQQIARQIHSMTSYLQREGAFIKAHNCDYLSDDNLATFSSLGVGAITNLILTFRRNNSPRKTLRDCNIASSSCMCQNSAHVPMR